MNIEVTSENSFARKVLVTVPATDVRDELNKAYKAMARSTRMAGFRKGKVPVRVLEARFGDRVRFDVANFFVQRGYSDALKNHDLEPVNQPSVVDQSELQRGEDFSFTIALEVRPEIDAENYTGLNVYYPPAEVTEDEVEAAVERRRQSQSRLVEITDRAVEAGDSVQVALKVTEGEDVLVDEPGTLIRTGGDAWFNGIEDTLVGMSLNDEKSETVTFSETARNESVKGKELATEVKVLGIQAYQTPELSDELAKELGHDDVAALTEAVRGELSKGREDASRNQARANLLQALIEANSFEVPGGMVEQNLQLLTEELKIQQAYMGRDPKSIQFSPAQIADLRNRAAFAAKGGLLLESVSKKESIEVTDEDIEAKYVELAELRGQPVEAIKGYFVKDDAVEDLRQRILEEKTLDWLLGKAEVTHEAPAAEEPAAEEPAAEEAASEE